VTWLADSMGYYFVDMRDPVWRVAFAYITVVWTEIPKPVVSNKPFIHIFCYLSI
jgi:hypothetical protein